MRGDFRKESPILEGLAWKGWLGWEIDKSSLFRQAWSTWGGAQWGMGTWEQKERRESINSRPAPYLGPSMWLCVIMITYS